jgi:predicted nucleic acid-binding Zn ribbon protein
VTASVVAGHPCAGCGQLVPVVAEYCSERCYAGDRFARRAAKVAILVLAVLAAWWVARRG